MIRNYLSALPIDVWAPSAACLDDRQELAVMYWVVLLSRAQGLAEICHRSTVLEEYSAYGVVTRIRLDREFARKIRHL